MRITTPIPDAEPIYEVFPPFADPAVETAKARLERILRMSHPCLEVADAMTDEGVPYISFTQPDDMPGGGICLTIEPFRPTYETAPDAASMIATNWGWVAYSNKREAIQAFGETPAVAMERYAGILAAMLSEVAEAALCPDETGDEALQRVLAGRWQGRKVVELQHKEHAHA